MRQNPQQSGSSSSVPEIAADVWLLGSGPRLAKQPPPVLRRALACAIIADIYHNKGLLIEESPELVRLSDKLSSASWETQRWHSHLQKDFGNQPVEPRILAIPLIRGELWRDLGKTLASEGLAHEKHRRFRASLLEPSAADRVRTRRKNLLRLLSGEPSDQTDSTLIAVLEASDCLEVTLHEYGWELSSSQ